MKLVQIVAFTLLVVALVGFWVGLSWFVQGSLAEENTWRAEQGMFP